MINLREHLFASTTPGLEPALELELRRLKLDPVPMSGGFSFSGPEGLHLEANLKLRTASRVLLRIGAFKARDPESFRRALKSVPLGPYWNGSRPLELSVHARRSRLSHTGQLEQLAREVWRLPAPPSSPPAPATGAEDVGGGLQLRLEEDECTVSIDTSGELLYKRGYRQEVSRAPLRETLAAGVLLLAGYTGDGPLWDPLCGSGTLVIEGALLALRRAAGLERRFAFESWPSFKEAQWLALKAAARAAERKGEAPALLGTDLHSGSLGTARRNARRAGVGELTRWERKDALTLAEAPPGSPGLLVANPPYGIRVGEGSDLKRLYQALGRALRGPLAGWRAALLTPEPQAEAWLGLAPLRSLAVHNGGIRCRLLIHEPGPGPG